MRETMVKEIFRSPLETERLKSWAMNKMAKEKEKRRKPNESSPSFKKDFTFNEEKRQRRTTTNSKTSKIIGKKPVEG
jgi:hypothetical protein